MPEAVQSGGILVDKFEFQIRQEFMFSLQELPVPVIAEVQGLWEKLLPERHKVVLRCVVPVDYSFT